MIYTIYKFEANQRPKNYFTFHFFSQLTWGRRTAIATDNDGSRRSAAKIESGLGTERALRQRLREAWVQNVQD